MLLKKNYCAFYNASANFKTYKKKFLVKPMCRISTVIKYFLLKKIDT